MATNYRRLDQFWEAQNKSRRVNVRMIVDHFSAFFKSSIIIELANKTHPALGAASHGKALAKLHSVKIGQTE